MNQKDSARSAFSRAMNRQTGDKQGSTVTSSDDERLIRYSIMLDVDLNEIFDLLLIKIRRKSNRTVQKSDIVRELIRLASDDSTLQNQIAADLRECLEES